MAKNLRSGFFLHEARAVSLLHSGPLFRVAVCYRDRNAQLSKRHTCTYRHLCSPTLRSQLTAVDIIYIVLAHPCTADNAHLPSTMASELLAQLSNSMGLALPPMGVGSGRTLELCMETSASSLAYIAMPETHECCINLSVKHICHPCLSGSLSEAVAVAEHENVHPGYRPVLITSWARCVLSA